MVNVNSVCQHSDATSNAYDSHNLAIMLATQSAIEQKVCLARLMQFVQGSTTFCQTG